MTDLITNYMANSEIFVHNVRNCLSDSYIPYTIINDSEEYDMFTYSKICAMSEDIDLAFAYRIFIQIFPTTVSQATHGSMIIYVGDNDKLLAVTVHDANGLLNASALYGFQYSKKELVSQTDNTYRFYF